MKVIANAICVAAQTQTPIMWSISAPAIRHNKLKSKKS